MNWQLVLTNAGVTAVIIGIVGWLIKRWVANVDLNMKTFCTGLSELRIELVKLAGTFIGKDDFETEKDHNSKKRENIWIEIKNIDKAYERRVTALETTVSIYDKLK